MRGRMAMTIAFALAVLLAHELTMALLGHGEVAAWHEAWYVSPDPLTSGGWMTVMLGSMPIGTMDEMRREMDPAWQVATFYAAADPDITFIEQSVRRHQMAVDASESVLDRLVHPELVEFTTGVIEVQRAEIDGLDAILDEMEAATPVLTGVGVPRHLAGFRGTPRHPARLDRRHGGGVTADRLQ